MLALVKHFAGYGAVQGGRDYDGSDISDELLHNVYMRPFHAAEQARAATSMSAYMNLNGMPATGNRWLLQDVLRRDWGFRGFVVSDWEAVKNLSTHGFAARPADAALHAVTVGVNMEMTGSLYRDQLPALIESGQLRESQLNELVRPILEMKYRLGLFTHPYVDPSEFKRETLSAEQRTTVRQAAAGTAVLLKNKGHVLPLKPSIHSVAVIGPLADSKLDTLGSWAIHGDWNDTVTVVQGLREAMPDSLIQVTPGQSWKYWDQTSRPLYPLATG